MSEAKYYSDIIDLPLRDFITCSMGNLAALIISGYPTAEQLNEAWNGIQQQYADATGDSEYIVYIMLMRDVQVYMQKFMTVQKLVEILEVARMQEYCDELNSMCGTSFAFSLENIDNYHKELQRCINRSKSLLILHDQKKAVLDNLKAKNEGGKPTREYYVNLLITLGDHVHRGIDDSITVYEFCERIRRYNEYCKQVAQWQKKG